MTGQAVAMLVVAAALLVAPGPAGPRLRLLRRLPQARGTSAAPQSDRAPTRRLGARADTDGEPLALAGAWELLAACQRAGLPQPRQ